MHSRQTAEKRITELLKGKDEFIKLSRMLAEKAQKRERLTIQPKENLSSLTKARITITNYLGGKYFFTVDEVILINGKLQLKEKKHSKKGLLPAKGDIIDGVVKMILFSNLIQVKANNINVSYTSVLELTSFKLSGSICSDDSDVAITKYFEKNAFSKQRKTFLIRLFDEAKTNNFTVNIKQVK